MTHRPLRIVVRATSLAQARSEAEEYFEWLKDNSSYDGFKFGSDTDRYWNEAPIDAIQAHKPLAQTQLRMAMRRNKREFAKNLIKVLTSIADEAPGVLTEVDGSDVDPNDFEDWMGLLGEWTRTDVTNPHRIEDHPEVLTEDDVIELMTDRHAEHRTWAPMLGERPYHYCCLYDTTAWVEERNAPVMNVEDFSKTLNNLDGKYVALMDAHF